MKASLCFQIPAQVAQAGHGAALNLWMDLQDARVIDWQQQILIVSPFFYPELISTGKANQHLAEAFVAEGHGVTVVCSHPLYPAWMPVQSSAQIPGMTIVRGGAGVRYPQAMPLRRLKLEAWFAFFAARSVWRREKTGERRRQHTSAQPVHLVFKFDFAAARAAGCGGARSAGCSGGAGKWICAARHHSHDSCGRKPGISFAGFMHFLF